MIRETRRKIIKEKLKAKKSQPILDGHKYIPRPLQQIEPDPNYKVDEEELAKSIEKNRTLIAEIRELRRKKGL